MKMQTLRSNHCRRVLRRFFDTECDHNSAAKAPMTAEWLSPQTGETPADASVEGGARSAFQAPFTVDAVPFFWRFKITSRGFFQ